MYAGISSERFEEIMDGLYRKEIWITVVVPMTQLHLYYPEFEFCPFNNGEYQFGTEDCDSVHMPFGIKASEIKSIHQDIMAETLNAEQLILKMTTGEVIIEYNC